VLYAERVLSAGPCVALRRRDDLARLYGELQHQPLPGDELARGRAGVAALEQVGCVEQLVVADLDGAPQLVAVAADGSLDDALVRAARRCGLDPNDPALLRLVTTGLSPVGQRGREGEFLLTCPRQNTGRVKVSIPDIPRIKSSITTTPGRRPSTASYPSSASEPLAGEAVDARPKERV
jgi:hypothetical protein